VPGSQVPMHRARSDAELIGDHGHAVTRASHSLSRFDPLRARPLRSRPGRHEPGFLDRCSPRAAASANGRRARPTRPLVLPSQASSADRAPALSAPLLGNGWAAHLACPVADRFDHTALGPRRRWPRTATDRPCRAAQRTSSVALITALLP
jgi:hypothetical protein